MTTSFRYGSISSSAVRKHHRLDASFYLDRLSDYCSGRSDKHPTCDGRLRRRGIFVDCVCECHDQPKEKRNG